jgi:hypothetical protein
MKSAIALAIGALILWPPDTPARPLYLSGTIGEIPALAMLERDKDHLSGWLVYVPNGNELRLGGRIDAAGAFRLDDFAPSGNRAARLDGNIAPQGWQGTWTKPSGSARLFRWRENRDALAGLTGQFRCTTKRMDEQFGYTYRNTLNLQISKGVVNAIAIEQAATSRGNDDHACAIDLKDLKQVLSDVGILLQAKDNGTGEGADAQRCTLRLVGTGDYLYLQIGDGTEPGNDCKGAGTTMFCAPRAFWSNMIVNRKTGTCRTVE